MTKPKQSSICCYVSLKTSTMVVSSFTRYKPLILFKIYVNNKTILPVGATRDWMEQLDHNKCWKVDTRRLGIGYEDKCTCLRKKNCHWPLFKKFCATGNWCVQLPEKQCCVHALGTNACTKLSRSSPLCCIYMFMFMIRTQEVYTLLIMKLAEHIYRPILSKSCFSCVLPLLLYSECHYCPI